MVNQSERSNSEKAAADLIALRAKDGIDAQNPIATTTRACTFNRYSVVLHTAAVTPWVMTNGSQFRRRRQR
jgi:hypothetical protein